MHLHPNPLFCSPPTNPNLTCLPINKPAKQPEKQKKKENAQGHKQLV